MIYYRALAALGIAVGGLILTSQPAHAEGHLTPLLSQTNNQKTSQTLLAEPNKSTNLLQSDKSSEVLIARANHEKTAEKPVEKDSTPTEVYITVAAGDSLTSIATANNTTWTRIFDANESISNPNVLNPGEKLRIPRADEQLPDRSSQIEAAIAAPVVAQTATTYTTRSYSSSPTSSSSYDVGNGMWCTDYVHERRPDVAVYGNAGYNWISSARSAGKSTGTEARQGAVAVTNGHVAYVESVNSDGSYTVSEMGWNYQAGKYNKRTVSPGTFGQFIY